MGGYKCGGLTGDPLKFFSKQKPHVEDRCPPGFKSGLSEECEGNRDEQINFENILLQDNSL